MPSTFAAFGLDAPDSGPFPSDRFTVADASQLTGRRVNLPLPDAATRPSDYADVSVINTLDGFNLQPRLSIPFSGPIDVTTVNSSTVFLIKLGDTDFARGHAAARSSASTRRSGTSPRTRCTSSRTNCSTSTRATR